MIRSATVFCTVLMTWQALEAQAIVIRHDRADSRYVVDEKDFPPIFYLHYRFDNKVCMATLINPQWAITAAHCTDQTPIQETLNNKQDYSLTIAGQLYLIAELVIHPDYKEGDQANGVDLALIRLDRKVENIQPALLNRETNEIDQVVSLLGWGFTGIGTVGRKNNDGKLRRAENTVLEAEKWLTFRFDDPRQSGNHALNLEGVPGLGDSGGPAFLHNADNLIILGVALGEVENPLNPEIEQGQYGAIEVYERISSHLDWIDSIADTL